MIHNPLNVCVYLSRMPENKLTQQIDVLELMINTYDENMNKAIDTIQVIENMLYIKNKTEKYTLKEYVNLIKIKDR